MIEIQVSRTWKFITVFVLIVFTTSQISWATENTPLSELFNPPFPENNLSQNQPVAPPSVASEDFFPSHDSSQIFLSQDGGIREEIESPYEYERYKFADAIELLRPEYASAVVVKSLTKKNLKKLLSLSFEVGIAVFSGEIVLFTSGNEEELHALAPAIKLLDEASFISHTHVTEETQNGPSYFDIQQSVSAPHVEYVLTRDGAFEYNQEGIKNAGNPYQKKEFLGLLENSIHATKKSNLTQTRQLLNEFIRQMDLYNEASWNEIELFRLSANVEGLSLDNFNRQDLGTGWAGGEGIWKINYDSLAQEGKIYLEKVGSGCDKSAAGRIVQAVPPGTQDYLAEADFIFSNPEGSRERGVLARYVDDSNYYYAEYFIKTGKARIIKSVNGNWTVLSEVNAPIAAEGSTHRVGLSVKGSTLQLYYDGTLLTTAQDFELQSGKAGLLTRSIGDWIDNFKVTTYTEAPRVTPPFYTNNPNFILGGTKQPNTSIWVDGIQRIPANAQTTWSYPVTLSADGPYNYSLQAKYTDGRESELMNVTIALDRIVPAGSVVMNSNASYTNSSNVLLSLTGSDALSGIDQMRFSTNNGQTWTAWEKFSTSKNLTLPSGDGNKQVLYQVRDRAGNLSASYQDSIILDTTLPSGSIQTNRGLDYTRSLQANLSLAAADSASGIDQMSFSLDSGNTWTAWENYSSNKTLNLTPGEGSKVIQYRVRDWAGNIAIFSDTIILDTLPPDIVVTSSNQSNQVIYRLSYAVDGVLFDEDRFLKDEGENTLSITKVDLAGNRTTETFSVNLTLPPPTSTSDSTFNTTNQNGDVLTYIGDQLSTITFPDGAEIGRISLDALGNLQDATAQLSDGSIQVFENGQTLVYRKPDGSQISYSQGEVEKVITSDGIVEILTYTRDGNGAILEIQIETDEFFSTYDQNGKLKYLRNKVTQIEKLYDSNGLLAEIKHPDGSRMIYSKQLQGSEWIVRPNLFINAYGSSQVYSGTSEQLSYLEYTSLEYDAMDFSLKEALDTAGNTLTFNQGLLQSIHDSQGNISTFNFTQSQLFNISGIQINHGDTQAFYDGAGSLHQVVVGEFTIHYKPGSFEIDEIEKQNGTRYSQLLFDGNGNVLNAQIEDPNESLSLYENGKILSYTKPDGTKITYAQEKPSQMSTSEGLLYDFSYNGNIVAADLDPGIVPEEEGIIIRMEYTTDFSLTKLIRQNQEILNFSSGDLISIQSPEEEIKAFVYTKDAQGKILSYVVTQGSSQTFYGGDHQPTLSIVSPTAENPHTLEVIYRYGRIREVKKDSQVILKYSYAYDESREELTLIEDLGQDSVKTYRDNLLQTVLDNQTSVLSTYHYQDNKISQVIVTRLGRPLHAYDYAYIGDQVVITDEEGVKRTYDSNHRLLFLERENKKFASSYYTDENGDTFTEETLIERILEDGSVVYYEEDGDIDRIELPDGSVISEVVLDEQRNIVKSTITLSSGLKKVFNADTLLEEVYTNGDHLYYDSGKVTKLILANGYELNYSYEEDVSGNVTAIWVEKDKMKFKYDIQGNLLGLKLDGVYSKVDESKDFVDSSAAKYAITSLGDTKLETFAAHFGAASAYFDGSGDYLTIPDNEDWNFAQGDFTVDFWVNFDALGGDKYIWAHGSDGPNSARLFWNGSKWKFNVFVGNSSQLEINASDSLQTNTWYHVALVRQGGNWKIYRDGVLKGSVVSSASFTYPNYTGAFGLGALYANGNNGGYFKGYIDEFRVSKGAARWTQNFSPPANAYSSDPDTKLLLHFDGLDHSYLELDKTQFGALVYPPSSYLFKNNLFSFLVSSGNDLTLYPSYITQQKDGQATVSYYPTNSLTMNAIDFGDGHHGDVTLTTNTTLTQDMYYNSLTINSGVTLNPNGYKIFVKNTLVNNGTISVKGGNGGVGQNAWQTGSVWNAGSGGTAGLAAYTTARSLGAGVNGGVGDIGRTWVNSGVGGGTAGVSVNPSLGGSGGIGGGGGGRADGQAGNGPRQPGTATPYYINALTPSLFSNPNLSTIQGGASGSSGAGAGAQSGGGTGGAGGGSGAGGGVTMITVRTLDNTNGSITAAGGNGGNGGNGGGNQAGAGGGGGGGGGGTVYLVYNSISDGTISAAGGTAGTPGIPSGGTIGSSSSSGATGTIFKYNMSSPPQPIQLPVFNQLPYLDQMNYTEDLGNGFVVEYYFGQLTQAYQPNVSSSPQVYFEDGKISRVVDANDKEIFYSYDYDIDGVLESIWVQQDDLKFKYDAEGSLVGIKVLNLPQDPLDRSFYTLSPQYDSNQEIVSYSVQGWNGTSTLNLNQAGELSLNPSYLIQQKDSIQNMLFGFLPIENPNPNYFGNGQDGDVTLTSNTTLARDMYYNTLTIQSGVVLNPAGYKIYVKGKLINHGTISVKGGDGGSGGHAYKPGQDDSYPGGGGGAGQTAYSIAHSFGIGTNGISGTGGTKFGDNVLNASAGISANQSLGGSGGSGGGGAGGGVANPYAITALTSALFTNTNLPNMQGGASGGAGKGGKGQAYTGSGGGGGGSGAGGGVAMILAHEIDNTDGTITAEGGRGGEGGRGYAEDYYSGYGEGGSGGGGGGGGTLYMAYENIQNGLIAVAGGLGGQGGSGSRAPSGVVGTNGQSGTIFHYQMASASPTSMSIQTPYKSLNDNISLSYETLDRWFDAVKDAHLEAQTIISQEYSEAGELESQTKADKTVTLFENVDVTVDGDTTQVNKPIMVVDASGNMLIQYEYDSEGNLGRVELKHARDALPEEREETEKQIEEQRQQQLLDLAIERNLAYQQIQNYYQPLRTQVLSQIGELNGALGDLEGQDMHGSSAKKQKSETLDQIRAGIDSARSVYNQLLKAEARDYAALDAYVLSVFNQIETDAQSTYAELDIHEANLKKEILLQEISPVVYDYYRRILGRDPTRAEYEAWVAKIDFQSGDYIQGQNPYLQEEWLRGGSALLDGNGDYLSVSDHEDFNLANEEFTIDFWVRFNSLPVNGSQSTVFSQHQDANNYLHLSLSNQVGGYQWTFSALQNGGGIGGIARATTLSANQWYHIALVKTGNVYKLFQNGVQLGSDQQALYTVPNFSAPLLIGALNSTGSFLNGYIDEYRISKDVARWTADFTPTTERYQTDAYTKLLLRSGLSQNYPFKDMSSSTHFVTAAGNVQADRYQYKTQEKMTRNTLAFDGESEVEVIADIDEQNQTVTLGITSINKTRLVVEAENYHSIQDQSTHQWLIESSDNNFSGGRALRAGPDSGANINTSVETTSPRLDYKIYFEEAGTYYLWIRGFATDDTNNSIQAGVDGTLQTSATRISQFAYGAASWSNKTIEGAVITVDVPTSGEHTVNFWMREDGFRFDKFILAKDAGFVPQGFSLTETLRVDANLTTQSLTAALTTQLAAMPELQERKAYVDTLKARVTSAINQYLNLPQSERESYAQTLGLSSDEVIDLTESDADKILTWINSRSLHFGQSAFLALESLLDQKNIAYNRLDLAEKVILIDILAGVITPLDDGDLVLSIFALNKVALLYGLDVVGAQLSYKDLLALFIQSPDARLIAHINGNHFVVITNVTEESVTYIDTGMGKDKENEIVTLSKKEFLQAWNGYVIVEEALAQPAIQNFDEKILSSEQAQKIRGAFFAFLFFAIFHFITAILSAIGTILAAITTVLVNIATTIGSILAGIGQAIGGFLYQIGSYLGNALFQGIKFAASSLFNAGRGIFATFANQSLFGGAANTAFGAKIFQNIVVLGLNFALSKGLDALGVNPVITSLITSFASGGIISSFGANAFTLVNFLGGGIRAILQSGTQLLLNHIGLDPQLSSILSLVTAPLVGGIQSGNVAGQLITVIPKLAQSLASYGIQKLGESLGLDPRISSLMGLPLSAGLGSLLSPSGGGGPPGDTFNAITNGLLSGAISLGVDYVLDELDMDPLLGSLTSRAITGAIAGLFQVPQPNPNQDPNNPNDDFVTPKNIFEGVFEAFQSSVLNIATLGGGFGADAYSQAEYLQSVTSFSQKIQEKGFAGAIEDYAAYIFHQDTISSILRTVNPLTQRLFTSVREFIQDAIDNHRYEQIQKNGEVNNRICASSGECVDAKANFSDLAGLKSGFEEITDLASGVDAFGRWGGRTGRNIQTYENGNEVTSFFNEGNIIEIRIEGPFGGIDPLLPNFVIKKSEDKGGIVFDQDGNILDGVIENYDRGFKMTLKDGVPISSGVSLILNPGNAITRSIFENKYGLTDSEIDEAIFTLKDITQTSSEVDIVNLLVGEMAEYQYGEFLEWVPVTRDHFPQSSEPEIIFRAAIKILDDRIPFYSGYHVDDGQSRIQEGGLPRTELWDGNSPLWFTEEKIVVIRYEDKFAVFGEILFNDLASQDNYEEILTNTDLIDTLGRKYNDPNISEKVGKFVDAAGFFNALALGVKAFSVEGVYHVEVARRRLITNNSSDRVWSMHYYTVETDPSSPNYGKEQKQYVSTEEAAWDIIEQALD